ncbi:TIGR02452 family protein [Chitinophaga eiseniae]|uniref:TIGR02452 family protein n=1 Tax=Chitinophaga eiseniae TaxID=634771 RepID=A0A847SK91_9BACT|nr:TIGR02452 family protein [Chitinophaga eiseniae]NLR77549.1 TIGR02452 family protein [Chitinophaga eiseniae]
MNKSKRTATAYETLEIMEKGCYQNQHNHTIDISAALQHSVANTIHYKPGDFETVFIQRDQQLKGHPAGPLRIAVTGETTFAAAYRLVVKEGITDVCCLNFASAKNPGGGFLGGAQAQEEALSRASGLYASLKSKPQMYTANRLTHTCLYTDNMIYSPLVPVFRNDRDELLDDAYLVSIITAPAVNAGAISNNEPGRLKDMEAVMLARIEKLLSVAVANKQTTLVLGAWGCGVFRNNPADIARWLAHHICHNEVFQHAFTNIVFAVYDTSEKQHNRNAFNNEFQHHAV